MKDVGGVMWFLSWIGLTPVAHCHYRQDVPPGGQIRKRLAFVIPHLGSGGAQRVAVNAANAFVERDIEIHIIINEDKNDYKLSPRVSLHVLTDGNKRADTEFDTAASGRTPHKGAGKKEPRTGLFAFARRILPHGIFRGAISRYLLTPLLFAAGLLRRSRSLRRKLKATQPDAVLSFLTQTNILMILATRGLRTRTVISERNDPRLQRHRPRVEFLRKLLYRHADVVTANSRGALTALESFVPKKKLAFLPNPLSLRQSVETAWLAAPTIVTVGQLVEQKGIDVLLTAWAKARERLPDWRLAIIGDGPLAGELQAMSSNAWN